MSTPSCCLPYHLYRMSMEVKKHPTVCSWRVTERLYSTAKVVRLKLPQSFIQLGTETQPICHEARDYIFPKTLMRLDYEPKSYCKSRGNSLSLPLLLVQQLGEIITDLHPCSGSRSNELSGWPSL